MELKIYFDMHKSEGLPVGVLFVLVWFVFCFVLVFGWGVMN